MNNSASPNPFASPALIEGHAIDTGMGALTEEEQLLAAARGKLSRVRFWILSSSILLYLIAAMLTLATIFFAVTAWDVSQAVANLVNIFLYFASAYLLLEFYRKVGKFTRAAETRHLEELYESESAYWKFLGIITLGSIALFVAVIVVGILLGLFLVSAFVSSQGLLIGKGALGLNV